MLLLFFATLSGTLWQIRGNCIHSCGHSLWVNFYTQLVSLPKTTIWVL